jgi:MFS family permease
MTDGDRYRRKLLFLLSSATFFEGYDTFVLAFVLALILGDLGGSEADAGWIRAITQLGEVAGFLLAGQADRRQTRSDLAHGRAVRRAGVPRRGVGGRDHDRRRGVPPRTSWVGARDRHLDEHPRGIFVGVLAFVGLRDLGPGWRSFFLVGLIPRNEERAGAMAGPSYEARSVARARGVGDQLPSPRGMGYVLALYPSHRAKRARCTRDLEKVRLVAARAAAATLALPGGAVAAI